MNLHKSSFSSDLFSYVLLLITVTFWGLAWPIGRVIVSDKFGPTIPQFMVVTIRYTIFVTLLFIVTRLIEGNNGFPFFKKHWKELSLMGLISVTFYQFGYLYGETYTAASDASLVVATSPIIVLFVAAALIKESITPTKVIGSIIAFLGVVIIVGFSPNTDVPNRLLGDGLVFFSAISYGCYTVLLRRLFNKYEVKPSSFHVLSWLSLMGLIFTLPLAIFTGPSYFTNISVWFTIAPRIWLGIIYLAIFSSLIAYVTYTEGVRKIGASRSAVFVNLVPVVGIAASIFIGETIDPIVHFLSFLLIFSGIMLVNKRTKPNSTVNSKPTFDPTDISVSVSE